MKFEIEVPKRNIPAAIFRACKNFSVARPTLVLLPGHNRRMYSMSGPGWYVWKRVSSDLLLIVSATAQSETCWQRATQFVLDAPAAHLLVEVTLTRPDDRYAPDTDYVWDDFGVGSDSPSEVRRRLRNVIKDFVLAEDGYPKSQLADCKAALRLLTRI